MNLRLQGRRIRPGIASGCVLLLLLCTAGVLSLNACGTMRTVALTAKAMVSNLNIQVEIAPDANRNTPVAVDLVIVYKDSLFSELLKLPSDEWFKKRDQIERDYLKGEDLDVWSWEWAPGQQVPPIELPLEPRAVGGIVFARYFTPGAHRLRIDPFTDFKLILMREGIDIRTEQ